MPFGIVMCFDVESDAAVRRIWGELDRTGIDSLMIEAKYRPHVSLVVCEELDVDGLTPALADFARTLPPFTLSLSSVGVFPQGVVFLGVTITEELLRLHREFAALVAPYVGGSSPYYQPGAWVPHCTLTMDIPTERLGPAVEIALRAKFPIVCRIEEIGIAHAASPTNGGTGIYRDLGTCRLGS